MRKVSHLTNNRTLNGLTESKIPNKRKLIIIYQKTGKVRFQYDYIKECGSFYELRNSNNVIKVMK